MEALMEFVSITQASDSVAKQFLQAFDNDVQAAVEAYFEDPEKYNSSAEAPNDAHSSDDYVEEDEDYVRAPMKPVRKRLIGEDLPAGRGRGWRQGNQSEAFRDLREEQSAVYGGRGMNKKSALLADLFRPPLEILFKGSFEKAKSQAVSKQRWLLINIQDPGIFDCQVLNRDTWSDDGLKATVKASFIMLQLYMTSDQTEEYTNWHSVGKLPHIAILDPETGERKWFHDGLISAAEIKKQFSEFLAQNPWSIDHAPPTTAPSRKGSSVSNSRAKKSKQFEDMTEEEQMEFVIAQSLQDQPGSTQDVSQSDDERGGASRSLRKRKSSTSGAGLARQTSTVKRMPSAIKNLYDSDEESDYEVEEVSYSSDEYSPPQEMTKRRSTRLVDLEEDEYEEDEEEDIDIKPTRKRSKLAENVPTPISTPIAAPKPPTPEPEHIIEEEEEDDEPVPEGDPDCTLQIRLPTGSNLVQKFHGIQKLKVVSKFVRSQVGPKLRFSLATTFPRRLFGPDELKTITLKDAGLFPRAVLVVEEM